MGIDLAMESPCAKLCEVHEERVGEFTVTHLRLDDRQTARKYGIARGRYVTVQGARMWMLSREAEEILVACVARELRRMIEQMCGRAPDANFTVLLVGLGNAKITPDALGHHAVSRVSVTRHLSESDPRLFAALGQCGICAVTPGVSGQTGIEAAFLVRSLCAEVRADLVIAVDALVARRQESLGSIVQLSDAGVCPGSGIGKHRHPITRETCGVPVLAVGIPTAISSATLVAQALEGLALSGEEKSRALRDNREKSLLVAPGECDLMVQTLGGMLALALEKSLRVG